MTVDLAALALNWIATYGSPMVAALLLLGGLGLPLPGSLIVIASGAFIRQNLIDAYTTPLLGLFGTVTGDLGLYGIGYFTGTFIEKRYGQTNPWQKARKLFEQRGGITIFFTRWLITALAFPVTLIAGSSRYSFRKYFLLVLSGEFTWILLYGGLGYFFGSQWELISELISNFTEFILGAMLLGVGIFILFRFRAKPEKNASS
ncbi:MAG: hypothetical protein HPY59_14890 [Anaerolineae bacterium]|nr:hypothetical protein [Anaerolineae bacterium]